jgi:hypothetical protein
MNQQQSDRDLLLVSIFTFLTVCCWVFVELARTVKTSTVATGTQKVITPLNPTLDTGILDILEQKSDYW